MSEYIIGSIMYSFVIILAFTQNFSRIF